MIKKLDKLILKAFIGPFIATFFITILVLIMQFFWLYIDDFVGKGLPIGMVFKFIWFQSAVLVPLALPLAILLSSLYDLWKSREKALNWWPSNLPVYPVTFHAAIVFCSDPDLRTGISIF